MPGGNTSRALQQLEAERLVLRRSSGGWSLTPVGDERAIELVGELDPDTLEPQLATLPGAEFGHELHTIIPPTMAPVRWARGIEQLLKEFPFETNVFLMTRFPRSDDDVIHDVIRVAREVLAQHGLTLHVASDRVIDEDLLGNIAAHMWACQYGIALFERRVDEQLNYNVLIEVGAMMNSGRRCALLKDVSAPDMPTDLVGQIYKSMDFADDDAVAGALHAWVKKDLGFGAK